MRLVCCAPRESVALRKALDLQLLFDLFDQQLQVWGIETQSRRGYAMVLDTAPLHFGD
jgi:hypothetical protein